MGLNFDKRRDMKNEKIKEYRTTIVLCIDGNGSIEFEYVCLLFRRFWACFAHTTARTVHTVVEFREIPILEYTNALTLCFIDATEMLTIKSSQNLDGKYRNIEQNNNNIRQLM